MAVGRSKLMVSVSRKKLERFLQDQRKEMKDFVSETDEGRFMDRVEDIESSSSSDMEMEDIGGSDISGISEIEMSD